ncbi:MAG: bifunctional diguanylate cyclase/phosphodiesterase [Halioglobus sp.]|nr:bifunctional diguanylate cyclase/phosphodiesterase [Halioglobus sp.]
MDLKNFHDINDTYGIAAGDSILQQVAARIRGCLQESDITARVGGDEFGIMLNCVPDRDIQSTLTCLRESFAKPFEVAHEVAVHCEVNAGIFVRPGESVEPEVMLQRAELALFHHVEKHASSPWQFYVPQLEERAHYRVALLNELRVAIEREEFELHFQPKVDLASGRLSGCEALVRWRHPTRGLVAPADFIPLAEKSELIVELGDWVLREACRQMRCWIDDGLSVVQISLNISISQVRRENFIEKLKSTFEEYRIDPRYLTLEITEGVFARDPELLIKAFNELQALGIRLSLDDFGTEYSSLQYLKNFHFDEIKLDQSFIRDMLNDPYCYELACMAFRLPVLPTPMWSPKVSKRPRSPRNCVNSIAPPARAFISACRW